MDRFLICLLKAIFNELIVLANKLLVDKEQKFLVLIWTSAPTCGTVVYCKGGADMAQMSLEELYRGEGVGEKYGILGEVMKDFLQNGRPSEYDERTWLEMLLVKHALIAAEKMKNEGDTVSGMTDDMSSSSYVRWNENDNA